MSGSSKKKKEKENQNSNINALSPIVIIKTQSSIPKHTIPDPSKQAVFVLSSN